LTGKFAEFEEVRISPLTLLCRPAIEGDDKHRQRQRSLGKSRGTGVS
jgi:hypothetical protein